MMKRTDLMQLARRLPRWQWLALAAVVVLGGWWLMRGGGAAANGSTFAARRGDLAINVIEGGSVEALESQDIRSEVKGFQGTKILKIVEEGYQVTDDDVKDGKVLVELDASELRQRMITQEIQFQSTLAGLTEAQQSYDIQLNQNKSDIAAAEQKAKFALMDFQKFVGDKLALRVVERLGLKEEIDTNAFDLARFETALMKSLESTNGGGLGAADGRGLGISAALTSVENAMMDDVGGGNGRPQASANGARQGRGGEGRRQRPTGEGSVRTSPGRTEIVPNRAEVPPVTTPPVPLPRLETAPTATNNPLLSIAFPTNKLAGIDFAEYAKPNVLEDGSAKQQLRKLMDDWQMAQAQEGLQLTKLQGAERLQKKDFITKTELETEQMTFTNNMLKTATGKTALDLFIKYEFPKQAEEFLSKYDEALRVLERTRKEAISKMAQSLAKMRAAEGRFKIEYEQLKEAREQLDKCTIRAQKTGLVVYGGESERWFGGEQIREGATVRERQRIITIPDMKLMSVKVKIHEAQIKKITKGLKAVITVDAFPDEQLSGEVSKVGVLPDSQNRWMNPDLKVYITVVDIAEVRDWLKPGMSAKVEIQVKQLTNVVYVPLQSVSVIQGKQVCYVANGGAPEVRTVDVGDFTDEFIEIRSGLKEGEKVLLSPPGGERIDTEEPPETAAEPEDRTRQPRSQGQAPGTERISPRREREGGPSGDGGSMRSRPSRGGGPM